MKCLHKYDLGLGQKRCQNFADNGYFSPKKKEEPHLPCYSYSRFLWHIFSASSRHIEIIFDIQSLHMNMWTILLIYTLKPQNWRVTILWGSYIIYDNFIGYVITIFSMKLGVIRVNHRNLNLKNEGPYFHIFHLIFHLMGFNAIKESSKFRHEKW